jgi:hypothetical protein
MMSFVVVRQIGVAHEPPADGGQLTRRDKGDLIALSKRLIALIGRACWEPR